LQLLPFGYNAGMKSVVLLFLLGALVTAQVKRKTDEFPTAEGPVRITPVRHASLMLEGGGQVVHVDPWSQGNYEGLPQADFILITDNHGDHLDAATVDKLKKARTPVVGPEVVTAKIPGAVLIRAGQTKTFGKWTVEAMPAYNLKRGPSEGKLFHEKGRGVGYVLTFGGKRIYISGDTEGIPEMKALRDIDVAFVCMNLPYTMPPEEAAEAVRAFRPKVVYPYHYRGSDLLLFEKGLAGTGIEVRNRDWYY
jgi:L-ascorbate metabolism protein UlaG (beta-lactamase superfamily)